MRLQRLTPLLATLALFLGGCTMTDNEPPFPEREFNNHEAYKLMEQLATDAAAELPDFPGFEQRKGSFLDCEDKGTVYDDWVSIELHYTFSPGNAASELVRTDYTNALREYWTGENYEITRDQSNPRTHLEAVYPGGITLWWQVVEGARLTIQSGCVPVGDGQRITDYIPPAGGVTPENDRFGRKLENAPVEVAEADDEESDEAAVNPFDGVEAAAAPPGINPFHDQL